MYLIGFARRLTSSSYSSKLALPALNATNLHRDQFGLLKLFVAVTQSGKVVAMDNSIGATVWSTNLGLFAQTGSDLDIEGMWVVREVGEGVNPTLAVIARRTDEDVSSVCLSHADSRSRSHSTSTHLLARFPGITMRQRACRSARSCSMAR